MALDPSLAEDAVFDERILGGGPFVEQVLSASFPVPGRPQMSLAELVQRVAAGLRIEPATLRSPSKERNIARAKAVISYLAVRRLGIKGLEVAAMLGYSSTAVSQAAKRGEKLLATEGNLGKMLKEIAEL